MSIEAWLRLKDDEVLFLEGAEDIDRVSSDATTTTQVKRTEEPISLNTKQAQKAIKNFWATTERAPDRIVRFVYLTTSVATEERNAAFNGLKGIDAWDKARHDSEIAELVRAYLLLHLNAEDSLLFFLKNATVDELQQKLFDRFIWMTAQPSVEIVKDSVTDRLVEYCNSKGLAHQAAHNIRGKLFDRCWDRVLQEDIAERYLDAQLLAKEKTEATTVPCLLPLSTVQSLLQRMGQSSELQHQVAPLAMFEQEIPMLPVNILERPALVDQVRIHLRRRDAVMLSGSVFKGKTTLAAIVVRRSGTTPRWIELTGRSASVIADIFRLVCPTLDDANEPTVVVFDDLDTGAQARKTYASALQKMVHRAKLAGKALLFTAQGKSESLDHEIANGWGLVQIEVPALEADDVQALCLSMGCPSTALAKTYGKLITARTAGHPKLVQVRVHELQERAWPAFDAGMLLEISPAVQSVKQMARELFAESVTAPEAEFIYEAGEFWNPPTRSMLLNLAGLPPKLVGPSKVLDRLQGRWIESPTTERFRVTPILRGEKDVTWTQAQYCEVHAKIYDAIVQSSPLFPRDVAGLLFHAIVARDGTRIASAANTLREANADVQKAVLFHLSWIVCIAVEEGHTLPEMNCASWIFRWVQLRTAFQESAESAPSVIQAWKRDLVTGPSDVVYKAGSRWILDTTILTSWSPFPPLALVLDAAESVFSAPAFVTTELINDSPDKFSQGFPPEATPFQVLLSRQAFNVRNLNDLEVLTDWLARQSSKELLRQFNTLASWPIVRSLGGFVHCGWAAAAETDEPQWSRWITGIDAAMSIAQRKGLPAFGTELARAKSIILCEYLENADGAVAVLDVAEKSFGPSAVLAEQGVNLLYHARKHTEALQAWTKLMEQYGHMAIDDPFSYRRAAICAGEVGNFVLASELFEKGSTQFTLASQSPTRMGLLADASDCALKSGNARRASALLTKIALELPEAARSGTDLKWHSTLIDLNRVAMLQEPGHLGMTDYRRAIPYALGQGSQPGTVKDAIAPDQHLNIQMFEAQVAAIESQWDDASSELMQRAAALAVPPTNPLARWTASQALLRQQLVAGIDTRFVDLCMTMIEDFETATEQASAKKCTVPTDETYLGLFVCGLCCANDPEAVLTAWGQSALVGKDSRVGGLVQQLLEGVKLPFQQIQHVLFDQSKAASPVRLGAAISLLHNSYGNTTIVSQTQGFLASAIALGGAPMFFASTISRPMTKRWALQWEVQLKMSWQFSFPRFAIPKLRDLIARAKQGQVGLPEFLSTTSHTVSVDLTKIIGEIGKFCV
ncbi:hypothetical protein [Verminephrobacter aporrectodeae]|uniref:hypothetical protein n=1 Tax=Verminephrobacter aporrectodeae TaxID=1110389 RepID=UPI0022445E44|nr:hypothetical protein [Verminephrobacter aporrectodeae]MCW8177607.1 hypothetical protein [Verminephrobacter aporrectodeae subsp. tuberculatae]